MFQLSVLFCSLFLLMTATAFADVQLIIPDNSYSILSGSKQGQSGQGQTTTYNDVARDELNAPRDENRDVVSDQSDGIGANSPRSGTRPSVTVSSGSTSIQHHILPPETIPLPLTISTRPGLRTVIAPETITIHEPTVAQVGEVVQKIPTAVSHQSSTIVHKHADLVTPIVAPAVRTISSHVVRAYHTPLIYAAQVPVVVQS